MQCKRGRRSRGGGVITRWECPAGMAGGGRQADVYPHLTTTTIPDLGPAAARGRAPWGHRPASLGPRSHEQHQRHALHVWRWRDGGVQLAYSPLRTRDQKQGNATGGCNDPQRLGTELHRPPRQHRATRGGELRAVMGDHCTCALKYALSNETSFMVDPFFVRDSTIAALKAAPASAHAHGIQSDAAHASA